MSLRNYQGWAPSIAPQSNLGQLGQLLALFDDPLGGEVRARQSNPKQGQTHDHFFHPRFDLKETKDYYQLDGELPGIKEKDITIEFTDEQTLVISGHSQSHHEEGTRPKEIEGSKDQAGDKDSHRARVEDEDAEGESSQVVKSSSEQKKEHQHTYWISERREGKFTRSFSFPHRVNQDDVEANLKDGILTIKVKKVTQDKTRKRINIGG